MSSKRARTIPPEGERRQDSDDEGADEGEAVEVWEAEEEDKTDDTSASDDANASHVSVSSDTNPSRIFDTNIEGMTLQSFSAEWKRPAFVLGDTVELQVLSVDYYCFEMPPLSYGDKNELYSLTDNIQVAETLDGAPNATGAASRIRPVIRIFGITEQGSSLAIHCHGYAPHLSFAVPEDIADPDTGINMLALRRHLNKEAPIRAAYKPGIGSVEEPEFEVVHTEMYEGTNLMHYQHGQTTQFVRVSVRLPGHVASLKRYLQSKAYKTLPLKNNGQFHYETLDVFEANVSFALQFMADIDLVGFGRIKMDREWVLPDHLVRSMYRKANDLTSTRVQLDLHICYDNLQVVSHDSKPLAPMKCLSFDIECAAPRGRFPDADYDPVIGIGNVIFDPTSTGDANEKHSVYFALRDTAAVSNGTVLSYSTEEDMLVAWMTFVLTVDPDQFVSYNGDGFDFPYIAGRVRALGILYFQLGRDPTKAFKVAQRISSSKQRGTLETFDIQGIDGRVTFDMLKVMKEHAKHSSYTLNAMSGQYLGGQQKEDLPHTMITPLFNSDQYGRNKIATYCLQDCLLPRLLFEKLDRYEVYAEFCRVSGIPLNVLLSRGQSVRVLQLVLRNAKARGYVLPTLPRKEDGEKFMGATVIEPKVGFFEDPIATLDFASLYPSIMISHNLCYSTLIRPENLGKLEKEEYEISPFAGHAFLRKDGPRGKKGILPIIVEELLAARKKAKAQLKEEKQKGRQANKLKCRVLDAKQLALKVSANSVYGFTGAQVGPLPCLEISSSVTGYGRAGLEATKKYVEENYTRANGYSDDAEVVYGDSVTGETPVMLKLPSGEVAVCAIDTLVADNAWIPYDAFKENQFGVHNKQQAFANARVWAHDGWYSITRIVRHRCGKKIFRVATSSGVVDCTQDHSLLTEDGEERSPCECTLGQTLLHGMPREGDLVESRAVSVLDPEHAFLLGAFFADGFCSTESFRGGLSHDKPRREEFYIEKYDERLLDRLGQALIKFEGLCGYDVRKSRAGQATKDVDSTVGCMHKCFPRANASQKVTESHSAPSSMPSLTFLDTDEEAAKALVFSYASHFYDDYGRKRVPLDVINASAQARQSFLAGVCAMRADKIHMSTEDRQLLVHGQLGAQGLIVLLSSLGLKVRITTSDDEDQKNIFGLKWSTRANSFHGNPRRIIRLHEMRSLGSREYVYDIEVAEKGWFNAGCGELVLHNTDSVMIKFGRYDLATALKMGNEAAEEVTKALFTPPMKLEFEKAYFPYLLLAKKRYAGMLYTRPDRADYMDTKGMENQRRDNCSLAREMVTQSLKGILTRGLDAAMLSIKNTIRELKLDRISIDRLIITKGLNKLASDYKGTLPEHVVLAERMARRDPGSAPKTGDRVPYVIVQTNANAQKGVWRKGHLFYEAAKRADKAEDPLFALEHALPIDTDWYLTKQIAQPLERIWRPIIGAEGVSKLLSGDHTRHVKVQSAGIGIGAWATRVATCLLCNTALPGAEQQKALCAQCDKQKEDEVDEAARVDAIRQLVLAKTFHHRECEQKYWAYWTSCTRCVGRAPTFQPTMAEINCTNSECPSFFARVAAADHLNKSQKVVARLRSIEW